MSTATHYVLDPSSGGGNAPHRPVGVVGSAPEVVQIQVYYRGVSLGGRQLEAKPETAFRIGAGAGADAPVAEGSLPAGEHTLVSWAPGGFVLHTAPAMRGSVVVGGRARTLDELGGAFVIEAGTAARIECGDMMFFVEGDARPPQVPRRLGMRWSEHRYTAMSGGALLLFLLVAMTVPPDPKALAGGFIGIDHRLIPIQNIPPEAPETPSWLEKDRNEPGETGKAHVGESGKAGNPKLARNVSGRFTQSGGGEMKLTKQQAIEAAKNSGLVGIIKNQGGAFASIFGTDSAFGPDAETVMGNLAGEMIGGYGVGGIGVLGTGSGGGGTGEGTIGTTGLGTMGRVGMGNGGNGYGVGMNGAKLGRRTAHGPEIIPGHAITRGALDREIVRRIIRRHINEVKYCYEQELTKKPDLGGRISVQFTIAGSGQVIASVLQSSTMNNARVENCIVQAVRRWEFPKPDGGGLVIVSYPFVLNPAGSGGE